MKWMSIRRLSGLGMVVGMLGAWSAPAQGQILDRVLGRDGRTRVDDRSVERNYVAPGQVERYETRDRDGRTYRSGTEFRSGSEIRGDAEYRGEAETRSGERYSGRSTTAARRGTALIGSTVRLEGGRSLGRVDDIVIGESGCVEFMVVNVTGLRGMSGRLAVLPFTVGEPDFGRRAVYVNWTEEDLRRAPIFFSSNAWPDFNDGRWTGDVFAFFEVDSHDASFGRAYRGPRDSERGQFEERSMRDRDTRDRDSDREERSYRGQDSRRSSSDFDRDEDRGRSEPRTRNRTTREGDDDPSYDRSSDDQERSSDRDRNSRSSSSDSRRKTSDDSESEDSNSKSSNRQQNSSKDLPD